MSARMSEYVLGTSDHELARLGLQQEVWGGFTRRVLDAVALPMRARALDAGCGPGFVTAELRGRVGGGSVVALDESPRWIEHVRALARREGWTNVELLQGRVETVPLAPASFDLVFLRWVLAFLPDPLAILRRMAAALKPGGALVVMDYNHEGISVFPESAGFRAAVRAVRAAYAAHGGDTWLMGRIQGLFRAAGLEPELFEPQVIAGGPGSPAHRWLDAFFPFHSRQWVEQGLMSAPERALFLREWDERARDPSASFFSPIVVGASARKP
jgi:SAM-dependent methyltransferase